MQLLNLWIEFGKTMSAPTFAAAAPTNLILYPGILFKQAKRLKSHEKNQMADRHDGQWLRGSMHMLVDGHGGQWTLCQLSMMVDGQ